MSEALYFRIVSVDAGAWPVRCEHYQIQDGWVQFYVGADIDWIVCSIPSSGFFFEQITEEDYEEMLERQAQDDNIDDQLGGNDELG
jgi:hypothetical protein